MGTAGVAFCRRGHFVTMGNFEVAGSGLNVFAAPADKTPERMFPNLQHALSFVALLNLTAVFAWMVTHERPRKPGWWLAAWTGVLLLSGYRLFAGPNAGTWAGLVACSCFILLAAAYRLKSGRWSPGVCLTAASLLAVGISFPAASCLRSLGATGNEAAWDLPQYFVVFGMMISLLENQAARLRSEVRDRRRAEKEARAASDAKSICLATVSHEIRTPMNGVIGMTDLLLDSQLSQEQREDLNMVKASAESLLSVINDVLDFAKIEAGRMTLDRVSFDLPQTVGDLMRTMSFRAHQKGLELISDLRSGVPATVLGDPGRLGQVLVNLVGNAIKFTDEGEVELTVETESASAGGTLLHFAVRDTGIGVPEAKRHLIFQPFIQADCSTTRRCGGTGLGLAVSSSLVSMMGGRLWHESGPASKGSIFHFTARFGVPDTPPAKPSMIHMDLLRNRPVLVVDDNATNRQVLQRMVARWGMRPVSVAGGGDALELVRRRLGSPDSFDLVLLDCEMPDMDGFQTAERLRAIPGMRAPLVMLRSVGYSAESPGAANEFAATLTKPVRQGELLQVIRSVMDPPPAPDPPPPEPLAAPSPVRAGNRILVAEDNPVNRTVAQRMLEKWGHFVATAGTGAEAVAAAESEPFDLILMDIQMPDMDGIQATAAIRRRESGTSVHVPIVAMTAHAMRGDEERCRSAGMDGYLSKPIQRDRLLEILEQFCVSRPPV